MSIQLVPVGPDIPDAIAKVLRPLVQAVAQLQVPDHPTRLANIATKALLPDADDWRECAAICDEINSVVVSTASGGVYGWTRADGSAL